jgi:hypothetical protein
MCGQDNDDEVPFLPSVLQLRVVLEQLPDEGAEASGAGNVIGNVVEGKRRQEVVGPDNAYLGHHEGGKIYDVESSGAYLGVARMLGCM